MLTLPTDITLTCPQCQTSFSLPVRALSNRVRVNCPLCCEGFFWFDGLPATLKREVRQEVEETIRGISRVLREQMATEQAEMDKEVLRLILERIVSESDRHAGNQ